MDRSFLLIYLVYGVTYILMGFIALLNSRRNHKFKFFSHISYISLFAIFHGISELLTVIVISDLFNDITMFLFIIKRVVKALSFIYLLKFAISFYIEKKASLFCKIPEILFFVWFVVLVVLVTGGTSIDSLSLYFKISIRYFMALPMGLFVAYTLFKHKDSYQEISGLNRILLYLSILFFAYALVDGMFVREDTFFPASIINNEAFLEVMKFPIQYLKIGIGVIGCILLKNSEELLRSYEQYELERVEKLTASETERIRIHNMIHDKTIQKLYSAGLLLENVKDSASSDQLKLIQLSVNELNDCINDLRKVIYDDRLDTSKSLSQLIEELISRFKIITSIELSFENQLDLKTESKLSAYQKNQSIWIIQEIIVNAIKHSQGSFCKIIISEDNDIIQIKGFDDGIGFNMNRVKSQKKYGLMSLQERSRTLNGKFSVESTKGGTIIWITMPL